jgi:hypothetical protein
VIDAVTLCESVADAVALLKVEGAHARQISDVPARTLVRTTKVHVNPAPETPVTVVLGEVTLSAATNANSSSPL